MDPPPVKRLCMRAPACMRSTRSISTDMFRNEGNEPTHGPTMPLSTLLAAAALVAVLPDADGRVVGVWADIENKDTIVGPYLRNATAIAHTAGLRLAVDAQVGWGFAANSEDPSRQATIVCRALPTAWPATATRPTR